MLSFAKTFRSGLQPVELQDKEGLALLNGTQFSTAHALAALFEVRGSEIAAFIGADPSEVVFTSRPASGISRSRSRRCCPARCRHDR